MGPCLPWGRILPTCAISMLRNYKKQGRISTNCAYSGSENDRKLTHIWCFNKTIQCVMDGISCSRVFFAALLWRHNGRDNVSNHQPHDCLLNRLFKRRSKKTSKLRVTGLCAGNSPGTGEFPAQMASNAENVSIWWRHHGLHKLLCRDVCLCFGVLA